MRKKLIPKKSIADIEKTGLREPHLDQTDRASFEEGICLFNEGRFWEAHESWENAWRNCEEESRVFFQGIIQAAAGFHLLFERSRPSGARKNLEKSLSKLVLFPDRFLNIDVNDLRDFITAALRRLEDSRGEKSGTADIRPPVIKSVK